MYFKYLDLKPSSELCILHTPSLKLLGFMETLETCCINVFLLRILHIHREDSYKTVALLFFIKIDSFYGKWMFCILGICTKPTVCAFPAVFCSFCKLLNILLLFSHVFLNWDGAAVCIPWPKDSLWPYNLVQGLSKSVYILALGLFY